MVDVPESQKYELDEDGYLREIVGPWVQDKHIRLKRYVGISRSVRAKFIGSGKAGATYIDLYAGSGRLSIRYETLVIHGSPLVAWHESVDGSAPFTQVHVADAKPQLSKAVNARLKKANAPIFAETGPAIETVDRVISKLHPNALHFAFLDPYNLGDLHFDIIRKLARLERMDILIHISIQDLQRNLQLYVDSENSSLDRFAPGWREHVDVSRPPKLVRPKFLEYWRGLLKAEGMTTTETAEPIVGPSGQRLYVLAFAARHKRALEFWEKIRNVGGDKEPKLF